MIIRVYIDSWLIDIRYSNQFEIQIIIRSNKVHS